MKIHQIRELNTDLIRYILISFVLLSLGVITVIGMLEWLSERERFETLSLHLERSMQHIVTKDIQRYGEILQILADTPEVVRLMRQGSREALYRYMSVQWKQMQDFEPHLIVLQFHRADGTSLLRMHRPEHFDDTIALKRPMLRYIHKTHKTVSGYETGLYGATYRIIYPVFDHDYYIGAIELGLHPDFVIDAVKETDGVTGIVFIKENSLELSGMESPVRVGNYQMQSEMTPEVETIWKHYHAVELLKSGNEVTAGSKRYRTYVMTLNDFAGEEKVKILIFRLLNQDSMMQGIPVFAIMLILGLILWWLVRRSDRRIRTYQEFVASLYSEQIDIIEENNVRYEALIQNSKSAIVIYEAVDDGKDFIFRHVNRQCEEIEKLDRSEMLGKKITDVFPMAVETGILDYFSQVWQSGEAKEFPITCYKDDRLEGWRENYAYKLPSGELVVIYEDRTQEMQTRSELDVLRERLNYAVNGTMDGLWDWDLETNDIYFSPRWKEMLGYHDEELSNILENWSSRVHPDDYDAAVSAIKQSHESGTLYENVHRLRHRDGHWVWILDRGQTIRNTEGKAVRMVGFHTDITALKALEQKLRESEEMFELFMNHLPASVLIKDDKGIIIYANSRVSDFFGTQEVVGKTAADLLSPEALEQTRSFDLKVLREGMCDEIQTFFDLQGQQLYFRTMGFCIKHRESMPYLGLVLVDVTQSYLDQQKIRENEKLMVAQSRHAAMGEMIGMIAHQWRQPITVIAMGANNMIADIDLGEVDPEAFKEEAYDIIRQTQYLSQTIDDFRNFFRPDKEREAISPSAIIQEAEKMMGKSLQNNQIELEIHCTEGVPLYTYSRELLQVFINLIKNAKEAVADHRRGDRRIWVEITYSEQEVSFNICDNGGGIDKGILPQIFDPYFSTKGDINGTGLGLYISKIIVEQHLKGRIEVMNHDTGTCFKIILPLGEV